MKIVYNKFIPFEGFMFINLFGILFIRKEKKGRYISPKALNHEEIHTEQMKELLYVGFYIVYIISWLTRLLLCTKKAYHSIPFEMEAYNNEHNLCYLKTRKHYAWLKYAFKY